MYKKIIAFLLIAIMTLGISTTAFAAEQHSENTMEADEIVSQLSAADYGTTISFSQLSEEEMVGKTLIQFDSIEEAEAYLKQLVTESSELATCNTTSMQNHNGSMVGTLSATPIEPDGWYTNTVSWWGGGNTSLFSMTNADLRFKYSNGVASNISVTNSYMSGLVGAEWTHKSGYATSKGGVKAEISVTGTWFIGIEILNFPIGATFEETLTSGELSVY
ncbi:MAG: hypothetical protein NC079_00235 [Clostridium sp.]|nr:hypothetical protein [Acetatifactor muris]MCM1527043.1 hypothetical protein [Bacteroides sp.]MCM1562020.1 hypothetical protein [Clostridium sp.]